MHQIITTVFLMLRIPFGGGTQRRAQRRRQVEQLLRTFGLSRKKAERIAHHIP